MTPEDHNDLVHNRALINRVFTAVLAAMTEARGFVNTQPANEYIDAENVRKTVESALRRAHYMALDAYRNTEWDDDDKH